MALLFVNFGTQELKRLLTLAMSLLAMAGFAQNADSLSIDVEYIPAAPQQEILFFVNGNLVPNLVFRSITPNTLASIDVSKNDTVVSGHTYDGTIRMTLKDGYAPSFVSLTELKKKHTLFMPGPTIFMIDAQFIHGNHDKLMVDEKDILKIEVSRINVSGDSQTAVNVVKLLTRSEENIKKSKEIRLKGSTGKPVANYFDDLHSTDRQMESALNKR